MSTVLLALGLALTPPAWAEDDEELIVVVAAPTPPAGGEPSRNVLDSETIRVLPGSNGDPVKAVQNLPGIARAPFSIGQLLLRGNLPEDSGAYLDGGRISKVFHFGGLDTAIHPELLGSVAVQPGGFGVRYGRHLGGVVELESRGELPDTGGRIAVDVFRASAIASVRTSQATALTVGVRRSYIDAVLNPILSKRSAPVRAPRTFDFQARWQADVGAGRFDALFFNAYDGFRIVGGSTDEAQAQSAVGYSTLSESLRLRLQYPVSPTLVSDTVLLVGPERQRFQTGTEDEAVEWTTTGTFRQELRRSAAPGRPGLRVGIDALVADVRYDFDVPSFGTDEQGSALVVSPSPYAEITAVAGPVTVTPGLRVDPWIVTGATSTYAIDPRISASVAASPTTLLVASFGRYSQFPTVRQLLPQSGGTPGLGPQTALQSTLGLRQSTPFGLSVDVTLFETELFDLVSGGENRFRFFTGPPPIGPLDVGDYANDGRGRVLGGELLVRYEDASTTAWLAATISRSDRKKRDDQPRVLMTYDQPFVVTAVASRALPKSWRVGARVRVASGIPYTPVDASFLDLDSRTFRPVYGEPGSERLPVFFSADLRGDKTWSFRNWSLTAYVDVQNATARKNVEWLAFSPDYTEERPITGAPILPTFGLEASW